MKVLMKKLSAALITVLVGVLCFAFTAMADDSAKPENIRKIRKPSSDIYAGSEFKLKAYTSTKDADDDYFLWRITKGRKIVKFDDSDRSDDDVELVALKSGTAKITCRIKGTNIKKSVTITVKAPKKSKISRRGKATVTVEKGDDFELKVKKSDKKLSDRFLKWSIRDTSIVDFDDDDRYDNEMEFQAKKIGVTTVTCTNTLTGKSVSYTVKVVRDNDDDDDDDDNDDKDDKDDDDDDDNDDD